MSEPKRIQQRRTKGWRKPEDAISVARPSKWGNPFAVDRETELVLFPSSRWMPPMRGSVTPRDRREAVERYRLSMIGVDLRVVFHRPSTPTISEVLLELAGKDLMCFCPLDQPCHADVLLEIANGGAR